MPVTAADDVVVQRDPHGLRDRLDLFRHLDVGTRRRRVTGRMVMDENDCRRRELQRPLDEDGLHGITGLGASKIKRYGKAFLETIARFAPNAALDNRLSPTVNQTLALYLAGVAADEIAIERSLDVSTVYTHFAEAIEAGVVTSDAVLDLDPSDVDEIHAVFERLGTLDSGKLGPAHAALDGRFDYGILKCLLAELA